MGEVHAPSLLRRLTLCAMGVCAFRQCSDDDALWGECVRCGKRAGWISRDAVRRYIEAEERDRRIVAELEERASGRVTLRTTTRAGIGEE